MNLALIGPEAGILSAGSPGVRKGPGGSLECPGGRRTVGSQWLGPGNTNLRPRLGMYPVYYPSRYPPGIPHPGTPLPHPTVDSTADVDGSTGACPYDRFRVNQGDPRGVKRTG